MLFNSFIQPVFNKERFSFPSYSLYLTKSTFLVDCIHHHLLWLPLKRLLELTYQGLNVESSKCYWIEKQIELFRIHHSTFFLMFLTLNLCFVYFKSNCFYFCIFQIWFFSVFFHSLPITLCSYQLIFHSQIRSFGYRGHTLLLPLWH